jgi:pimeloyl-ACP methyl ester carboxylesterase
MEQVDLGQVTLAYEVTGEGDPLLLLAGLGQPAEAFHVGLTGPLVAAGYQVVIVDNRGMGPSSAPPAPYSVAQMAGDALGLLDHLGHAGPVRVAGHSLGGWIAETLAARHPDRVRAAALMGSANTPTAWEKAITEVERDLARADLALPPLFYATEILRYLPNHELQRNEVVEGWLAVLSQLEAWPNPGRVGQYEAALAWSTDPAHGTWWPTIAVPCLVLGFEHDIDSPPAYARAAAAAIPGARYEEVAGASHLGFMTHAQETSRLLIEFFATA